MNFLECNVLDNFIDILDDLENYKKNVVKFVFYIKQRIGLIDKFLVYFQDRNLLGVDYFVYRIDSGGMEVCFFVKKFKIKENLVLYFV